MADSTLSLISKQAGVSPARLVAEMVNSNTNLTSAFTEAGNGAQHHHMTMPSHVDSARFIAGLVNEHVQAARAEALADPATMWRTREETRKAAQQEAEALGREAFTRD